MGGREALVVPSLRCGPKGTATEAQVTRSRLDGDVTRVNRIVPHVKFFWDKMGPLVSEPRVRTCPVLRVPNGRDTKHFWYKCYNVLAPSREKRTA